MKEEQTNSNQMRSGYSRISPEKVEVPLEEREGAFLHFGLESGETAQTWVCRFGSTREGQLRGSDSLTWQRGSQKSELGIDSGYLCPTHPQTFDPLPASGSVAN